LSQQITIHLESPDDKSKIFRVVSSAFEHPTEAQLVDLIRDRNQALISLTAVQDSEIVGHVLVSPIAIEPASPGLYGGLAPLSVLPRLQRKGIGSLLMQEAIARSREIGLSALFLLGHPDYYARFGFTRSHIGNEYDATDAFMHIELDHASLTNVEGIAKYVEAFAEVDA